MFETLEEYFKNFLTLPFDPNQKKWEEIFINMAVHTRKMLPDQLLLKRRPNEEEHIHHYRLTNYEPITYGSMNKALDDLYRILSGISYSIIAQDALKEFIKQLVFEKKTLDMYLQSDVMKRMIEDPNGFLVWVPTGEGTENTSTKVIPQPKLFYSTDLRYSDENVTIFLSDELSPIKDGKKIVMKGLVYWVFNKNEFWKMRQTGTIANPKWEQELIYKHNFNYIPVITLGGDKVSGSYYESFFSPYLAFGNEAIRQFSDWQAIMTTSSFPYIEQFALECELDEPNLQSENIPGQEENFSKKRTVLKALGSDSPYNKTLRKVASGLEGMEAILPPEYPSRRYIHSDINVAKYAGEAWVDLIERAELALNIDLTVGVDQSGKAKQIDKESQYSMLTKIGNNFYDNIFLTSLRIIDGYISASNKIDTNITINKPATFWIKNEQDLVIEITTLKEKNVPSFFLAQATLDLAKKRFAGSPVNEKIFNFISLYDPLYIYTTEEKSSMLVSTAVSKELYVKSIHMFSLLNQIAVEKTAEGFMNMSNEQILAVFNEKIKQFLPSSPLSLTNPDGSPAIDGADTPVDVELQAKANLKGSVGGVQGILSIQASVSQGTTDYDAALAILDLIYGFPDAEARRILGDPELIKKPEPKPAFPANA